MQGIEPAVDKRLVFVQCKEKAVCLICQEAVAVFKEHNLRRRYESRHEDKYDSLQGQMSRQTLKAKMWTVSSAEYICTPVSAEPVICSGQLSGCSTDSKQR